MENGGNPEQGQIMNFKNIHFKVFFHFKIFKYNKIPKVHLVK